MNRKTIWLIFVSLFYIPQVLLARGGGGGGGGGSVVGSGSSHVTGKEMILTIIFTFALILLSLFISILRQVVVIKKSIKIEKLLNQLDKKDIVWNYNNMMAQIETVFFKVQEAWMKRDQGFSKSVMSDKIFNEHKAKTDLMIEESRINILSNISIEEISIFDIEKHKNIELDKFSTLIKAEMIDYEIDEKTQKVLNGSKTTTSRFTEVWRFIRFKDEWVLDEIDQRLTISDVVKKIHLE